MYTTMIYTCVEPTQIVLYTYTLIKTSPRWAMYTTMINKCVKPTQIVVYTYTLIN